MANGMSVEYQFWGSTVSLRAHVYRWMSFLICSCSLLRSSGRSRALRREALALAHDVMIGIRADVCYTP